MPHRSFDQMLACMRLAAGTDAEALGLIASFEQTAFVIEVCPDMDERVVRRDPTNQDPSRVVLLVHGESEEDEPVACVQEFDYAETSLDALHVYDAPCPDSWYGVQILLTWRELLYGLEREIMRGEYNAALAEAEKLGATHLAIEAQVKSAHAALAAHGEASELAMCGLAARLVDARLSGALSRTSAECPKRMDTDARGTWIGRRVYDRILEDPPTESARDRDTRDYILNCAVNWFVRDEPKTGPLLGSVC